MILQETIDDIQNAADILEVVEDFVSLKKRGQNWVACCPFHDEKTPSFSVNPNKGIYKCFGCGKAGDSITFIREVEGLSYIDALKFLAKKYAIEIKEEKLSEEQEQKQSIKESLYIVLNYAKDYFNNLLLNSSEGKTIGLSYFKERGFKESTIEKFELGYSKDEWNAFEKEALKKGYKEEILEQAGLIVRKEEKQYDRFRGRVIFPIHNLSGRVIAFGARTLIKKGQPKYLNSPETEVYHKSDVLYGIYQAKNKIRQENNCYLVEGYTDVISLQQAGIENVVASSGTSLTENQIKLIKRFSSNITVLYDGDTAGIKASLRGIDLILEKDLNVKVVTFPEGEDPDSYVSKIGGEAFKKFLNNNSIDFILFKTRLFAEETKGDPIKKAEVIRDIVQSITKIPDEIKRNLFYTESSKLLGIDEEILLNEGNKILLKDRYKSRKQKERKQEVPPPVHDDIEGVIFDSQELPYIEEPKKSTNAVFYQEQECIRILLQYGHEKIDEQSFLYQHIFGELDRMEFTNNLYKEIFKLYRGEVESGKSIDENYFIHHSKREIKEEAITLMSEKGVLSKNWNDKFKILVPEKDEALDHVIYTNILRLKFRTVQNLVKESHNALKAAKSDEETMEVLQVLTELKKQENELASKLAIVLS